jgi:hypothetical protein
MVFGPQYTPWRINLADVTVETSNYWQFEPEGSTRQMGTIVYTEIDYRSLNKVKDLELRLTSVCFSLSV